MDTSLGRLANPVIPSAVEGSRGKTEHARLVGGLPVVPRDPSTPQRSARDDRRGETAAHLELKRLAVIWAQDNGYPITALEVSLPQCRYRADVAAYRPQRDGTLGHTVVFECKQSAPDLRRDDRRSQEMLTRLESVYRRRQILEKHLRIHYPTLRTGDTLFPEWDAHDFGAIHHRGYERVTRQLIALQSQLREGRKFEKLARYACANLFYLVLPDHLLREPEAPLGWGLLLEKGGALILKRKPIWHDSSEASRLRILQKIGSAGTRQLIRRLEIADPSEPRTRPRFSIGRNSDSS
jgi:hypothetical protein